MRKVTLAKKAQVSPKDAVRFQFVLLRMSEMETAGVLVASCFCSGMAFIGNASMAYEISSCWYSSA